MPTIAEHLGVNFNVVRLAADGETIPSIARLGFEIELEKHEGGFNNVRGWRTTDDGSLRGTRIEYIFDGGAAGEEAERRIQAMHEYLEREPAQPTFRCSTHLHMDMQSADFNEVEKVVLAYMVFEDSFFDQHDRYRRTSNFCIPFMNNDWFAQFFGRRILGSTNEHSKFANCSRWSKYSALNLNVLAQHGTIEFRGSEALMTKATMTALALRMLSLRKIAQQYLDKTHLEFIEIIREQGIGLFLRGAFPDDYVPDQGGLDAGMASALLAITTGELENNEEARQEEERRVHEAEVARQEEQRRRLQLREGMGVQVTIREGGLTAAHIAAPRQRTVRGILETVVALRRMNIDVTASSLMVVTRQVAATLELASRELEQVREIVQGIEARDLVI